MKELVLLRDERTIEERLEDTIKMAMAQIDQERKAAKRDEELMQKLLRENNKC